MKSVRIYKDDIRVHILRSLFFTDSSIVLIGVIVIAAAIYLFSQYVLHMFIWSYYISSVIVGTMSFIAIITQKVDNQPIYKIVPRLLNLNSGKKERRYRDLEPDFTDFLIQDGLIVRNGSISKMLEIEPYDVALLNEQDRENFFLRLKQAINVLPTQVQFIVRKERAEPKDYSKHFFTLYGGAKVNREPLISRYIEDVSKLIESETLFITRHFSVLSVNCNTTNTADFVSGVKKLNDMCLSVAAALLACNVTAKPLTNEQLVHFMSSEFRS